MTDEAAPEKRGPGRPKGSTTGTTKLRTVKIGPVWELGQATAGRHGLTMTALVEEALRREIARLERQEKRTAEDS